MGKEEKKDKKVLFTGKTQPVAKVATPKKKRIRRTQKQIIVDKIEKTYKEKVISSVFGAEMKKIIASLDVLQSSIIKTKKPKEDVILAMFSSEELENLLKQKKQIETK